MLRTRTRAAGWWAQMIPLSYGGTNPIVHCSSTYLRAPLFERVRAFDQALSALNCQSNCSSESLNIAVWNYKFYQCAYKNKWLNINVNWQSEMPTWCKNLSLEYKWTELASNNVLCLFPVDHFQLCACRCLRQEWLRLWLCWGGPMCRLLWHWSGTDLTFNQ